MADGGERRGEASEVVAGTIFLPVMMMEDILDKLKLLNYEKEFCSAYDIRPLSRHHFALSADSSQQFFQFASLCSWLLSVQGKNLERVQEYDDPNATVATLITTLKSVGAPTNYPPGRLKQGHGDAVLQVLDFLAEAALRSKGWTWRAPRHDDEATGEGDVEDIEEEMEDDSAEVKTGKGGEYDEILDETQGMQQCSDDEDDDAAADAASLNHLGSGKGGNGGVTGGAAQPKAALVSRTDASAWHLEVERVLPSLKVHVRVDDKDWRVRAARIQQHTHDITERLADARLQLGRLHDDIGRAVDKMASRERYVNAQLAAPLGEYRRLNDTRAETSARYAGSSGGVTELTRELAAHSDELDALKAEMDEYGQSLSDAAPLVHLKQALTRLKADVVTADMRAGVMQHVLTVAAMTKKTKLQKDLNIERPTIMSGNYGEFNTV